MVEESCGRVMSGLNESEKQPYGNSVVDHKEKRRQEDRGDDGRGGGGLTDGANDEVHKVGEASEGDEGQEENVEAGESAPQSEDA